MTNREKAMQWWHKMNLENKFYKTIEHNNLIIGDHTRHPDSLTGSEIELIYNEQPMTLSECCGAEIYTDTDICSNCKEHC